MDYSFFIYGLAGFLSYEVIRLYLRYVKEGKDLKDAYTIGSIIVIILVAGISGLAASIFAEGVKSAIFVGLGAPAIISRLGDKPILPSSLGTTKFEDDREIDDIELVGMPTRISGLISEFKDYFEWE